MAAGMNDSRYSCSLTTVNPECVLVSIRLLWNSGQSGCVSPAEIVLSLFVTNP